MPALSFAEVSGEAEPPIAEQLISSNALRQRRFRERRRNVTGPLQPDRVAAPAGDDDGNGGVAEADDPM
jgi:hypothetical protein